MTPESFAAFYSLYPRKVARKSAEKAWARVATSEALIEQIMAGLRAQLPMMLAQQKVFIPHPSTWLNGHRWKDERPDGVYPVKPRVIACEKCGDTGVVVRYPSPEDLLGTLVACSCRIGQLPGVLAGVEEAS